jgi:hypothetical protein
VSTNKYALAAVVIILTTLACRLLSPSLPASPTPEDSSNAPLVKDDFSDSGSGWAVENSTDDVIEYANDSLRIKVWSAGYFVWSDLDNHSYQDIHIEVTAQDASTDSGHSLGLMCDQQGHANQTAHYFFALDPSGYYEIGKRVIGKDDVILTGNGDWTQSSLIPKNASSYRLGADCGHGTLTFYVNGKKLDSVTDNTYTEGLVALFVWSVNESAGPVSFDDFVMTSLK